MPSGGHVRAGRLPDFDGKRIVLPREGRVAPAPAWPLPGTPSTREAQLWRLEWARPQALLWELDGLENDVALYVRKRAEAETPGSSSASVDTMRRLQDDLLLTVPAMRRAGIAIGQDPATPASGNRATLIPITSQSRTSSRDRFRRIDPADSKETSA